MGYKLALFVWIYPRHAHKFPTYAYSGQFSEALFMQAFVLLFEVCPFQSRNAWCSACFWINEALKYGSTSIPQTKNGLKPSAFQSFDEWPRRWSYVACLRSLTEE